MKHKLELGVKFMNFNQIQIFLYGLINEGIKIWTSDKKIKLLLPNDTRLSTSQQKTIESHKDEILSCLEDNNIYSESYDFIIFRNNTATAQLSYAQERLWFIEKYEGGSNAYNISKVFKLSNSIRFDLLEKSLISIIKRHEILRTVIKEDDEGNGYQETLDESIPFQIRKITLNNGLNLDAELQKEIDYIYDLSKEYPIRAAFYTSAEEHYLSIVIHHIAFDGWSMDVLLREIQLFYHYFLIQEEGKDEHLPIPNLSIQYKDFALWQRNYLSGKKLEMQLKYWTDQLSGHERLNLLTDKPRPSKINYAGSSIVFEIDLKTSKELRALAKELSISLYTVLLSAYYLMLQAYSNQNDIIIGSPISNRHIGQVENLIGFFVNVLPLRMVIDPEASIKQYVQAVGEVVISAQVQQDLPFEKLVSELNLEKDTSQHPISQVMFGLESFGMNNNLTAAQKIKHSSLQLEPYLGNIEDKIAKLDLSMFIDDSDSNLIGSLNYATSLFNEASIKGYIETYLHILAQLASFAKQPEQQNTWVKNIKYINAESFQRIIYQWNATKQNHLENKTIHELFEEQAAKTPNNIAIVFEKRQLTYNDLNIRANQLANYIRNNFDIKANSLIALCIDRNEHMLVAILAVLKVGGAYVPIDPDYPEERIKYILQDTATALLLANEKNSNRLRHLNDAIEILEVDKSLVASELALQKVTSPTSATKSTNLAYVMYTSGTTGNPKGVMIEHKGVINTVFSLNCIYDFNKGNKVAAFTSYAFDISVSEFFATLLRGGELYLLSNEVRRDPYLISKFVSDNSINYIYIAPALLPSFPKIRYSSLQAIIYGGEPCDAETGKYWSNNCKLYNYFGPTETTIYSIGKQVINGDTHLIGLPLDNTICHVLDAHLNPLPVGAVGELYIGGAGLARGYLNKPELTAEKFIRSPFIPSRLYKTGDLVRYHSNGVIEYIGRNDAQVKIRGYRIELAEIQSIISAFAGIRECIVLVHEHKDREQKSTGNKFLVGYYVSEDKINEEVLFAYLKSKLPEYMAPKHFVHLDTFPLTTNGKLDRQALAKYEIANNEDYLQYAPENEIENRLCKIWEELLDLEPSRIKVNDNFFDLGGNSILIIKLRAKIEKEFKKTHLKISDLFKYNTIKYLADFISNGDKNYTDTYSLNKGNNFSTKDDIAVISMSGAFSGSSDIGKYWDNIVCGKECLTLLSDDLCKERGVQDSVLNDKNFIAIRGEIEGIGNFDPNFWNLSLNDAMLIDPQIRKFLEHCWWALEQSGYIRLRKEKRIGVYAGMSNSKYFETRISGNQKLSSLATAWEIQNMSDKDFLATRISYLLGLTGPSLNINTACSTSLVAIVEACKNLVNGSCDMALAGGVSFSMPENHGYIYNDGLIFSKDGHCRSFDENSSGTTLGSGVGVVVLKRLQDAIEDKNNIIAVIKGYATNNDGDRKVGYTAPSVKGQTECILEAQHKANIKSNTVSYVECHGTGTALGDPLEIAALHDAFSINSTDGNYSCILGSVKANIGHADSAAGVAGFIKVCKMLQNNLIPPQINFTAPNKIINLEMTNFKISINKIDWPKNDHPTRAGVSSFGIGGTNAHVVLEAFNLNTIQKSENILDKLYILPISAKTETAFNEYCKSLHNHLCSPTDLRIADLAFTLQNREHFSFRHAIISKDKEDAIHQLNSVTNNFKTNPQNAEIIFMFPGQGTQYTNMASNLYLTEPVFKSNIDECCDIIYQITSHNFKEYLYPVVDKPAEDILKETKWAQIAIFVVSYSLAKLLEYLEVKSNAYIGHSIGEYVAATLSGVFDLTTTIKIILKRGELMQKMPRGSMLMVNAPASQIQTLLPHGLEIAVYNAPNYNVISGGENDIESFKTLLDTSDIPYSKLQTSHAFHSFMMEDAAIEFERYLKDFTLNEPNKVFVSNITGELINKAQATSIKYWSEHMRMPVKFAQGVAHLNSKYKNAIYIEVGPGKGLSNFIHEFNISNKYMLCHINSLPNYKEHHESQNKDIEQYYKAIASIWNFGCDVNLLNVWKTDRGYLTNIDLPTYQFEKYNCLIDLPAKTATSILDEKSANEWFYHPSWKRISKNADLTDIKLNAKTSWLVFRDKNGTLDSFINKIQKMDQLVIVVDYSEINPNVKITGNLKITINPYIESHYDELLDYLITNNIKVSYFIHGWTIGAKDDNPDHKLMQYLGLYSLHLFQHRLLSTSKVKLVVLSNGINQVLGNDKIHFHKGTILGATRVIAHEAQNVMAFTIDIGFDTNSLTENIMPLMLQNDSYSLEPNYSIRFGYLWKEDIEAVCFNKDIDTSVINDNDVILITGGLGGIGLAIAKKISLHHIVKFILVSRNGLSKANGLKYYNFQVESLEIIRKNKCEVETHNCDISDNIKLENLIAQIKEKHQKIDGVIHAASSMPLHISQRTLKHMEEANHAKVLGASNLYHLFAKQPLKFFIMMSSLASIMGDIGRLEYCAANSFLDVLSSIETSHIKHLMAINWPGWSNIGMVVKSNNATEVADNKDLGNADLLEQNVITEAEGATIFYSLINQTSYKQIIISKFDINKLQNEFFTKLKAPDSSNGIAEPDHVLIEQDCTELETKISKIFFQILGNKKLSINDNYFELGGNSLSAIRLMGRINKELDTNLSLPIVFKQNTIRKLAQHITNNYKEEHSNVCSIIDEGEF